MREVPYWDSAYFGNVRRHQWGCVLRLEIGVVHERGLYGVVEQPIDCLHSTKLLF